MKRYLIGTMILLLFICLFAACSRSEDKPDNDEDEEEVEVKTQLGKLIGLPSRLQRYGRRLSL